MDRPVWYRGTITDGQALELLDLSRKLGQGIEPILTHMDQVANHDGVVTMIGKAIMATGRNRARPSPGQYLMGQNYWDPSMGMHCNTW